MRVAVLGAGLLALTLDAELTARDIDHDVFGHDAFEVTDEQSVDALPLFDYDVAINTVAMHSLAACEADPKRAHLVNTEGAGYVAKRIPTIYISTDYVFNDGGPHDESLPGERPRSVYGQTKLGGELATLERDGIVVRVSSLFGKFDSHKGKSFPDRLAESWEPVRLPTDQVMSPTWAPDAAVRIVGLAISLAGEVGLPPAIAQHFEPTAGVYHAANAGSCSWAQFGEEVCNLLRHRRHVTGYAAHDPIRPRNSALRSTRLPPLPHWRLALEAWEVWRYEDILRNRVSPLREGA